MPGIKQIFCVLSLLLNHFWRDGRGLINWNLGFPLLLNMHTFTLIFQLKASMKDNAIMEIAWAISIKVICSGWEPVACQQKLRFPSFLDNQSITLHPVNSKNKRWHVNPTPDSAGLKRRIGTKARYILHRKLRGLKSREPAKTSCRRIKQWKYQHIFVNFNTWNYR